MPVSHAAGPQVIELIGPAGAGKTGLLRAIAQQTPTLRTGVRLDRVRTMPVVAWHALSLMPATVELFFTDARWLWTGLRHLWRLGAFPSELERARGSHHQAILLDEGPVFSLGRLSVFQRANEGSGWPAREWSAQVARWSEILTGVILLDADNETLAQRIRERPKNHSIKAGSDREVFGFLDRYRMAYRDIVTRLTASGRVQIVEFDTTNRPFEQIASDIVTTLDGWAARSGATTGQRRT
jgi:shikimate kinase